MGDKQPVRRQGAGYHPLRKLRIALAGMRCAILLDFSVCYKLVISLVALLIAATFESLFHFLFMLAVTGLMLVTEVLNTAVESLCDYVQPALDDRIRDIKDMVAAAAMIAIMVWCGVLLIVLYEFVTSTELLASAHHADVSGNSA